MSEAFANTEIYNLMCGKLRVLEMRRMQYVHVYTSLVKRGDLLLSHAVSKASPLK